MSRNPFLLRLLSGVFLSVGFLVLFPRIGQAQDALSYNKNYFVTGDVVIGGVGGMRSTGVNGFATATINISGVPDGADVVAAFLYWETVETTPAPSGANGFFDFLGPDGKPTLNPMNGGTPNAPIAIVGDVRGNPNNTPCWSSGGTGGSNNGAGRVYVADVLRYLPLTGGPNNSNRVANGSHTVKLPDGGGIGNGNIVYVDGASLVVVYQRLQTPGTAGAPPLRSVVIYDGAFTMTKLTRSMTQTIGGFYDALGTVNDLKMTHIVANGQSGNTSSLTVNNGSVTTQPNGTNRFTGAVGTRWDTPTFNFTLPAHAGSYSTTVTSSDNQICLTWAAIVTSTAVFDDDNDGLLNVWETNGLHLNANATPATFGTCATAQTLGETCVNLPAMGASPLIKDIFLEFDWLSGGDHLHKPKIDALKMVGDAFHARGINLHFDLGDNYQNGATLPVCAIGLNASCIIASTGVAINGGEVVEESTLLCPRPGVSVCTYSEPYSVISWKVGFEEIKDGSTTLSIPAHFARDRKDVFHYVLFAHALAIPELSLTFPYTPTGHPKSVSGVADRPGGDLIVTLGRWRSEFPENDQVGSVLVQAGTLMHELGHNLNLAHAGSVRAPNCVPNYPSVMNYLYQSRGLTDGDNRAHVDYSYGTLTTQLTESPLSETASLGATPNYRIRYFGPIVSSDPPGSAAKLHCDGTVIGTGEPQMLRLENTYLTFIDWDHSGNPTSGSLSIDVNYDGQTGTLLPDFNDWNNLNLQQVGIRASVGDLSLDAQVTDLSASDPASPDFASPDFASPDFASPDFASPDFASPDFASPDFGNDEDYQTHVLSTVDPPPPPSPDCPTCGVKATNKIDRITLTWTAPSTGAIDHYNVYRSDPAHPTPVFLKSVSGGPPTPTTTDDVVNDTTHSGATCPGVPTTCYNTTYTYYVTSVVVVSVGASSSTNESGPSNTASGVVKHLFVTANASRQYGQPNPAFVPGYLSITGQDVAALNTTAVICTTTATTSSAPGSYPIHCEGPPAVVPTGGTDAIDGITYTDGTLTITKADQTIDFPAPASPKTYGDADFTVSATASSGLTVTFTASGNCTVSGTTVHITGAGSCIIAAKQPGDSNYNAAPDVQRTVIINKAPSTTTIASITPEPSIIGGSYTVSFTVTAGVGTPTGTVMVSEGAGGANCTATLPTLNCSLTPTTLGSKTVTATYSGDTNIDGSTTSPGVAHKVEYSVTLSALKTPAKIGSAIPINFQLKNATGTVFTETTRVLKIDSVFNIPQNGVCAPSSTGTRQTLYLSPNFSTGKSSLRFVSNSDQFNWDSSSAQVANGGPGPGCYTILIYLDDRLPLATATPRLSGPVELRN